MSSPNLRVVHLFEDKTERPSHSSFTVCVLSESNLAENDGPPNASHGTARTESDAALEMEPMGNAGKLTKTEG